MAGRSASTNITRYAGIQVQTSSLGLNVPVGWGTFRCKANLIDYLDFKSTATKASSGKGGSVTTGYNYSATIIMGLCEGPIDQVLTVYKDGTILTNGATTALAQAGLSMSAGAIGQAVWSYLSSNHPDHAIGYSGLCITYASNYPLGSGATAPNHSFEVRRTSAFGVAGTEDADPSLVLSDFLTNARYGVPSWNLGGAPAPAVTNYFQQSVSMLSSPWTGSATAAIDANLVDPNGAHNVLVLTFSGTGFQNWTQADTVPASGAWCESFYLWARGSNIGKTISIDNYQASGGSNARVQVTLTATPTLYYAPMTLPGTSSGARIICYDGSDTAREVLVWGPQLEPGTTPTARILTGATVATRPASNGLIGSLTQYQNYCLAAGLIVSPVIDAQRSAADFIKELLRVTNSTCTWSEGVLKIIPYGDATLTSNGKTYVPNVTPIYALGDDSFIVTGDEPPIIQQISDQSDAYNVVQLEFLDRTNQYNMAIALQSDAANVAQYGPRRKDPDTCHCICDPTVASISAQLFLQRTLYIRDQFAFKLSWAYMLLEPGDIVTITDTAMGFNAYPVRIIQIDEDEQTGYSLIVEDCPVGVANTPIYTMQGSSGFQVNQGIAPGNANAPVLFNAPPGLTGGSLEVWIGTSGGPNWGGAQVWTSIDGTNYQYSGTIEGPARYGITTSAFAAGADPDTVNTVGVDLTTSGGQLSSASQAVADASGTLCMIDGELISYEVATLTALNKYILGTYIRRGQFGTAIAAHNIGAPFVRIDGALFEYAYLPTQANATVYLKFVSFNLYGQGLQDISTVPVFEIIPAGVPAPGAGAWAVSGSATTAGETGAAPIVTLTGAVDQSGMQSVIVEYRLLLSNAPTWGPWQRQEFPATSTTINVNVGAVGDYQVHVRYRALGGAENAAAYLDLGLLGIGVPLSASLPNVSGFTTVYQGGITQLAWTAVVDFRKPDYEVRVGPAWASAVPIGRTTNTTFTTSGDATYWVGAHYAIPNGGGDVYSASPSSLTLTGTQLTKNVISTYSEYPGWTGGTLTNCSLVGGYVQLNAGVTSGNYQVPSGHRINVGKIAACNVVMAVAGHGVSLTDDVFSVTDFLAIPDLLDGTLGPVVTITPQIRLSQDGSTYGAWTNWSAGAYSAWAFDFRVLIGTLQLGVVPVVTQMTISVDVPDRIDSYPGTATSAGADVTLTYQQAGANTPFNGGPFGSATPNVQATILNAQAGDDLIISSSSASAISFSVKNGGARVVRTVSLIVQGF